MSYRTFIYDEDRNFIFGQIPKVACTNWKSVLRYLAGHPDYLDRVRAHDRVGGGLRYLDPGGPEIAIIRDPEIPKYAFVRDPYSRILSAYLNKIEPRVTPGRVFPQEPHFRQAVEDIDAFRRTALDPAHHPAIDFEVFLRWRRDGQSRYRWDAHWQKQTVLLRYPAIGYDFIGRFEMLDDQAPVLLKKMGCDVGFPTQGDVGFSPTNAGARLAGYYTPVCYRLVNEIYAADFAGFGYETRLA